MVAVWTVTSSSSNSGCANFRQRPYIGFAPAAYDAVGEDVGRTRQLAALGALRFVRAAIE